VLPNYGTVYTTLISTHDNNTEDIWHYLFDLAYGRLIVTAMVEWRYAHF